MIDTKLILPYLVSSSEDENFIFPEEVLPRGNAL